MKSRGVEGLIQLHFDSKCYQFYVFWLRRVLLNSFPNCFIDLKLKIVIECWRIVNGKVSFECLPLKGIQEIGVLP